jgi:hypothetical protein
MNTEMKSIGPSGTDVWRAAIEVAAAVGILWFFQQPTWLIILIAFLMAGSWRQVLIGDVLQRGQDQTAEQLARVIELLENAR